MLLRQSTLEKLVLTFPKSLTSDYYKVFGLEDTEKLLTVFSGMTIRVPSTKDVERAIRDISIFESLVGKKGRDARQQRLHLVEQHRISLTKVRKVFRKMKRVMRLSMRMKEAEAAVSVHEKPKKIKKSRIRERSKF
jgi:hypothetical protein